MLKNIQTLKKSEINIMKRGQIQIDSETLPDTIIPKGLDAARQWYLYDEIRPYCKNTSETLTSCCKLTCAKPSQRVNVETDKRKCPKKFAESETLISYSVNTSHVKTFQVKCVRYAESQWKEGRLKFPRSSSLLFRHSYCLYRNKIVLF